MIELWAILIYKGQRTIEECPEQFKTDVQVLVDKWKENGEIGYDPLNIV